MRKIQGPSIFLAQFIAEQAPFNQLSSICHWAADLGFKGIQLPTNHSHFFDLTQAAQSKGYCDEIKGIVAETGLQISELSTHLQGQLVAVNPVYDQLFDGFAPPAYRQNPRARQAWAIEQLKDAAKASAHLGLTAHATFSGSLLWPTIYPWPQRPKGLVEQGFAELAKRWLPILNAFDEAGVDVCFELHPGEDLHDGASFERFLAACDFHPRANILYDPSHFLLQQMDYLGFIDLYHQRIKAFHVKDAEFAPSARAGVYGGFLDWQDRPGRFRSTGDGQIDFSSIFSKLTQYGYQGWATLEWECCIKDSVDGAREGSEFIRRHLINPATGAFDDFASAGVDQAFNNQFLGI